MPLASLDMTVVLTLLLVDGMTPPPQRLARRSVRSLRLAFTDAGPSADRRARSLAFARLVRRRLGRIFVVRRVLRYADSRLSAEHGLRRATLRARLALRSRPAFARREAAAAGRLRVCLTSDVSVLVALTVFVDLAAWAGPASTIRRR